MTQRFDGFSEEEYTRWEKGEHTLQEWIEWAEHIDNTFDSTDDTQYEIKLKRVDDA